MRKIHLILPVILLLLASCGGNSPEKAIEEFYTAIKNKDFDKAEELSSKETKSMISLLKAGSNFNVSGTDKFIDKVECITENEIAECDCWFDGSTESIATVAILEDGKWKIDAKATIGKMAGDMFGGLKDLNINGLLEGLKDIDLGDLMKNLGGAVEGNTEQLNEIIKNVDIDEILESVKGMDSTLNISKELLEEKMKEFEEGMEKLDKAKK